MVGLFSKHDPHPERKAELNRKAESIKKDWSPGETIIFKNERIAILQSVLGYFPQFIVAFDNLTKNGYRLMTCDDGQGHGGTFSGGASRYYFQKIT